LWLGGAIAPAIVSTTNALRASMVVVALLVLLMLPSCSLAGGWLMCTACCLRS
jgi:hypothetical protein